jgi:hypothetical protein
VGKTNPAATDLKQQPGFQPRKQTLNAQRSTPNAQRPTLKFRISGRKKLRRTKEELGKNIRSFLRC